MTIGKLSSLDTLHRINNTNQLKEFLYDVEFEDQGAYGGRKFKCAGNSEANITLNDIVAQFETIVNANQGITPRDFRVITQSIQDLEGMSSENQGFSLFGMVRQVVGNMSYDRGARLKAIEEKVFKAPPPPSLDAEQAPRYRMDAAQQQALRDIIQGLNINDEWKEALQRVNPEKLKELDLAAFNSDPVTSLLRILNDGDFLNIPLGLSTRELTNEQMLLISNRLDAIKNSVGLPAAVEELSGIDVRLGQVHALTGQSLLQAVDNAPALMSLLTDEQMQELLQLGISPEKLAEGTKYREFVKSQEGAARSQESFGNDPEFNAEMLAHFRARFGTNLGNIPDHQLKYIDVGALTQTELDSLLHVPDIQYRPPNFETINFGSLRKTDYENFLRIGDAMFIGGKPRLYTSYDSKLSSWRDRLKLLTKRQYHSLPKSFDSQFGDIPCHRFEGLDFTKMTKSQFGYLIHRRREDFSSILNSLTPQQFQDSLHHLEDVEYHYIEPHLFHVLDFKKLTTSQFGYLIRKDQPDQWPRFHSLTQQQQQDSFDKLTDEERSRINRRRANWLYGRPIDQ